MTTPQLIVYILAPVAGYFLGSIPFAFFIGKAHGVDIRTVGSRNVGATNLGRTLGKKYFWQAFFLDAAKGFTPVLIMALYVRSLDAGQRQGVLEWSPLLAGIGAMIGHLFPVWLKFKGGKGVATGFGVVLGFWPIFTLAGLVGGSTFVLVLFAYRYISVASMVGSVAFALCVMVLGRWHNPYIDTYLDWDRLTPLVVLGWMYSLLIFVRHRANIGRLLAGTEPKVGQREINKARMPETPPPERE